MKTYLVTGGAGFIGSNYILYMLKKYKNIRIINLDKLTYAGNLENLKDVEQDKRYIFVKGDICDKELVNSIFKNYNINYVVNFAAETHVDRSINDPEIFIKTNVLGTDNLLNCAKESWECKDGYIDGVKYLQISTDEVYGSLGNEGYFTEATPINPHSPYSSSKAGADLIVKAYYDTYKMPVNITRCSNNYGPYQFLEKLIPLLINNCLKHEKLPVYGDGMNVRDWLYVGDHAKAIDMVINNGKIGEVYNVGGHNEKRNIEIVKLIINYIHDNVDNKVTEELIKYVRDRKGHDKRYAIDPGKIKNGLGWFPETNFENGIKKTIDWYLNNIEWVNNVNNEEYNKYYKNMYDTKVNK